MAKVKERVVKGIYTYRRMGNSQFANALEEPGPTDLARATWPI